jgi:rSAM/selenodomain-associated transferase 1
MLKAPRVGAVKTRLGKQIGTDKATRAYRALVEHQLRQIPADWPVHVFHEPADADHEMRAWLGDRLIFSPQISGDLGERLANAMQRHFHQSDAPLVIIGGDCPYLSAACFAEVEAKLAHTDAVLIPALDGGYCLIALHRNEPDLFRSISWGTPSVFLETRARLNECGLHWLELGALEDVDDSASWQRAVTAFPELQTGVL